jgi:two-component system KDP operon response regulator KdpE
VSSTPAGKQEQHAGDQHLPGSAVSAISKLPGAGGASVDRATGARVLVIDDEAEIQRAVHTRLSAAGLEVKRAFTAEEGIERVVRWHPDVVILDLNLPDLDGQEVCRHLRSWTDVPIVVLSVRADDAEKVSLLELGADDYLVKPFSSQELLARVRVALRHAAHTRVRAGDTGERVVTGGLVIDILRRHVTMDGRPVSLTPTEYAVVKHLAAHAGQVVTHRTLLRSVWGPDYANEEHYLHVLIGRLRRKLEPEPSRPHYLLTEPGVGYRLRSPD